MQLWGTILLCQCLYAYADFSHMGTNIYMSAPLRILFKTTDRSTLYLIRLRILYKSTSVYLFSSTSRKYRAFPNLIHNFMNTSVVTRNPHSPSLLSKYAHIFCRYQYISLLNKSHHMPIINITTQQQLL